MNGQSPVVTPLVTAGNGRSAGLPEVDGRCSRVALLLGDSRAACRAFKSSGVPVAHVSDQSHKRCSADLCMRCPPYGAQDDAVRWTEEVCGMARCVAELGSPVLFPTSDRALLAIARCYDRLAEVCTLSVPKPDIIAMVVDKVAFARWAVEHGIPVPAAQVVPVGATVAGIAQTVPGPWVVKPDHTFAFERVRGVKLLVAQTPEQIDLHVAACHSAGLNVVVQSDLLSLGAIQWSLAGVCDADGKILGGLLARKLRQVRWGAGTAVETVPMDQSAWNLASRLCAALKLRGLFEVELLKVPGREPVVLEVNTRIWTQIRLPKAAGMDLALHAINVAGGTRGGISQTYRPWVGWLSLCRDIPVSLRLLRRRELSIGEFLRSLWHVRVMD